jgi:7-carboxy-7-deazaguanine synthase
MFGQNTIVGRKYFADANTQDRLLVTSLFVTLQGEGPLRGEPAFFVRLAKCNLACSFCDTEFESGDWFSYSDLEFEIDRRISQFFKSDIPEWASDQGKPREMVLVITGGEPMLQTALGPFLDQMLPRFLKIQIETNGTLYQELPESVIIVCSPKCAEAKGEPRVYLRPHPDILKRAACLKFVMEALPPWIPGDDNSLNISPYCSIPDWAHEWHDTTKRPIFISPMNIYARQPRKSGGSINERSTVDEVISFWEPGLLDMEANKRNHEYAARYAIQHGYIFNVQQHLLASVA